MEKTYLAPPITRRIKFVFNDHKYQYHGIEKGFSELGYEIPHTKLSNFWKELHENCGSFKKLKEYRKTSTKILYISMMSVTVSLGVVIVRLMPIWDENNISLAAIIVGLVLTLLTITVSCLVKQYFSKQYMKNLYREYATIVSRTVKKYFSKEISEGLNWQGGNHGFKCLEFWIVMEKPEPRTKLVSYDEATRASSMSQGSKEPISMPKPKKIDTVIKSSREETPRERLIVPEVYEIQHSKRNGSIIIDFEDVVIKDE
jgi:hypothetical protein